MLQGSVTQIIEKGLHAAGTGLVEVVVRSQPIGRTVHQIGPLRSRTLQRSGQRPVMSRKPVVELQTVDMAAGQIPDDLAHLTKAHGAVRRQESVTREAGPVARDINPGRGHNAFLASLPGEHFDQIPLEILRRRGPAPLRSDERMLFDEGREVSVTDIQSIARGTAATKADALTRLVTNPVSQDVEISLGTAARSVDRLFVATGVSAQTERKNTKKRRMSLCMDKAFE